jgi:modulator of FtsH protease
MNTPMTNTISRTQTAVVNTNTAIRQTCSLTAMVLLFSALTTVISMRQNLPHPGLVLTLVAYSGLLLAPMNAED